MKCLVARLVTALDARSHPLIAQITGQLPTSLWDLLYLHNWLHERGITKGYLWNPHCAEKMCPFRSIGLLECTVGVGAKYAGL